jgi:membrane protein required for colicin V production
MNGVDVAVLAVAAFSGVLGFLRGVVREIFGLAAWIGATVASVFFYDQADRIARHSIANPDIADPVAFGAVFLIVLVVLTLVARMLGGAIRKSALGGLDRTLGLVYGLARGAALVVIAYVIAAAVEVPDQWPEPVLEARTLPSIYTGAVWAVQYLPVGYRPVLAIPPATRPTSSAELLHANPVGRAGSPPPARP